SDEGLAIVAEANGDFLSAEPPAERSGSGFWARENSDRPEPFHAPGAEEAAQPAAMDGVAPEALEVEPIAPAQPELKLVEPAEAEAPVEEVEAVEPPAPAPAPVAEQPAEAAPEAASQPPRAIEQPRADIGRVITEADPNAPKKGGWWQRAKASITGN
ncbi:MAG: ribonuclease E/G, partial [Hyphomicrobiales bacterium]|nr:ribonuclease E/G [Hyphomicrobiales bacterium]